MSDQINHLESSVTDLNSSVRLFLSNLNFDPNEQREIEKSLNIGSLESSKRKMFDDADSGVSQPSKLLKVDQGSKEHNGGAHLFSALPPLSLPHMGDSDGAALLNFGNDDDDNDDDDSRLPSNDDIAAAHQAVAAAESSAGRRSRRPRSKALEASVRISALAKNELAPDAARAPQQSSATRTRRSSTVTTGSTTSASTMPPITSTPLADHAALQRGAPGSLTGAAAQMALPSASEIIGKANQVVQRGSSMLASLGSALESTAIPMSDADYQQAKNTEQSLQAQLSTASNNLLLMQRSILLQAADQHRLIELRQAISVQLHQLEIYQRELDFMRQYGMEPPPHVDLFVAEQPFPVSVYHHKPLPGPLLVRLFKSARANVTSVGVVKAIVCHDMPQKPGKEGVTITNSEKKMVDGASHDYEVNFQQLTFKKGTRLHLATLQFQQQVKVTETNGSVSSVHLESNATQPLIVTTHENQWAAAEGSLFENTVFGAQMVVSWPELANWFQILYLRSTRQNPERPHRPLVLEDLAYLHRKLDNKLQIERSQWKEFWKWLEEGFRKIRFAKHLCDMWVDGLIAGFLNRTDVEALLADQIAGSFIVRLSDSSSGLFVISFVHEDEGENKIKHYLVTPEDTSTKKSLAEFMRLHPRLVYLLQVSCDSTNGTRTVTRVLKDTALHKFYSKTAPVQVPTHYERRI
mmetsp:Transcript_19515/g.33545  ORF Transcript_19515/g.33545 Transcript_19515/m.33545 type:complete len:693 (-) Transcript_19515:198-2276(-)